MPRSFMDLMNKVFHPFLDHFVVVFMDDFLISSESKKDHERLTRKNEKFVWSAIVRAAFKS